MQQSTNVNKTNKSTKNQFLAREKVRATVFFAETTYDVRGNGTEFHFFQDTHSHSFLVIE